MWTDFSVWSVWHKPLFLLIYRVQSNKNLIVWSFKEVLPYFFSVCVQLNNLKKIQRSVQEYYDGVLHISLDKFKMPDMALVGKHCVLV